MMSETKSTRFNERTNLEIPVEVTYRETVETSWREQTQIEEITVCGGGFTVTHPLEPKRLVHLRMPLPIQYRLYDFGKKYYDVWGLVRYARLIDAEVNGKISLKVGVALVGSEPPRSFLSDPATLYDLKPVLRKQSLWQLRELPRTKGPYARPSEKRHALRTMVTVHKVADDGRIGEALNAETQNISESGMALTTKFSSPTPNYLIVKSADNYPILAKIRGAQHLTIETELLHLEFISGKWAFDENNLR